MDVWKAQVWHKTGVEEALYDPGEGGLTRKRGGVDEAVYPEQEGPERTLCSGPGL